MEAPDVMEAAGFSRRHALLGTLMAAPLSCGRARRPSPSPGSSSSSSASGADSGPTRADGGLHVVRVSDMRDDQRGGLVVVVLHGWGAPGDDLVPLAHALRRPGVRFFVPAGPLPEVGGGRAWWHLDPTTRPPHAQSDQAPAGFRPTPAVVAARAAIQQLLAGIVHRHAPATVALMGFSQGAMLSMDVALAGTPAVDRVVAMSGVLLADSVPGLTAPQPAKPRFLLSHGRQDPVVPFAGGERARDMLQRHGFDVSWRPFEGQHEIPQVVLADVDRFLFSGR